jgi:AraC family transcriptional regulator of adaptative response/methylated-DNA-[protein]-cysteine methyltransferase
MNPTATNERAARRARDWRTDEARWSAVQSRERAADGAFFYAVRTTGVYCRPSCAARSPLRGNVEFHATAAAAQAAGFRACKRCRPGEPGLAARRAATIAAACRLIEQSEALPRVADLAAAVAMSRFHFQRVFKEVTGLTPQAFAREKRTARLREQLSKGAPVTEAIYAAGFNSSGRFYAEAGKTLGMPARDYRAGGANAAIHFAVGECSLGAILVAASERGVCAILLGDDAGELAHELEDRFPKASIEPGDRDFEQWVARVVGLVEAPQVGCDLPLDIRGSAFEQRVWRALRDIPLGSTASYAQIAAAIGAPTSVRAVARACAANALAVAIPCHRVVRSDGDLAGYRWGIERKRALLDAERRAVGAAAPAPFRAPRARRASRSEGRHPHKT